MNSALVAAAGKGASPFQNVEQQACQEAAQVRGRALQGRALGLFC
jgi:hypothetical protein